MEIAGSDKTRTAGFAILAAALAAIAIGLAVQTFMAARAVGSIQDDAVQRLLAKLAWLSTVLLALTLVLLFWTLAKFFRWRMRSGPVHGPTPYVDAWSLAGKRLKLPDENPPEQGHEPDRGEEPDD